MSLDPIGDLRNQVIRRGDVIGYRIETERALQLGINFRTNQQFNAVDTLRNIAIIWNGVGFQWVTFDNIDQLWRNLSDINADRQQIINDDSGDLLSEEGAFFRFVPP